MSVKKPTIHEHLNAHSIASSNYQFCNLHPFREQLKTEVARNHSEAEDGTKSIQTIFKNAQNAPPVDHDSSILSPSAYLVDLMRLIQKKVSIQLEGGTKKTKQDWGEKLNTLKLENRRPDLGETELSAENTTHEVPYLEIVNDLLRTHLHKVYVDENLSTEAKKRKREYIAREQLAELNYPIKWSYHAPLEQIRSYLSHFELSLTDVFKAFNQSKTDGIAETFGMPPQKFWILLELCSVVFANNTNLECLAKVYGLSDTNLEPLYEMDTFLKRAGLTPEEFEELHYSMEDSFYDILNMNMNLKQEPEKWLERTPRSGSNKEIIKFSTQALGWMAILIRLKKYLNLSFENIVLIWKTNESVLIWEDELKGLTEQYKFLPQVAARLFSLSEFIKFNKKYDLPVDVLCSLVSPMSIDQGRKIANQPALKPLFQRVFSTFPFYHENGDVGAIEIPWDSTKRDEKNLGIRSRLMTSLKVLNSDLQSIIDHLCDKHLFPKKALKSENIILDNVSLTRIYRFSKMAQLLKMKVPEYLLMLKSISKGTATHRLSEPEITNLSDLLNVDYWADWLKEAGLSAAKLYDLATDPLNKGAEQHTKPGLTEADLINFKETFPVALEHLLINANSFEEAGISSEQSKIVFDKLCERLVLEDFPVPESMKTKRGYGKLIKCGLKEANLTSEHIITFTPSQVLVTLEGIDFKAPQSIYKDMISIGMSNLQFDNAFKATWNENIYGAICPRGVIISEDVLNLKGVIQEFKERPLNPNAGEEELLFEEALTKASIFRMKIVFAITDILNRQLDLQMKLAIEHLATVCKIDTPLVTSAINLWMQQSGYRSVQYLLTNLELKKFLSLLDTKKEQKPSTDDIKEGESAPFLIGNDLLPLDRLCALHSFDGLVEQFKKAAPKGADTAKDLADLIKSKLSDKNYDALQTLSGWNESQIKVLHEYLDTGKGKSKNDIANLSLLVSMKRCLDLCETLGIDSLLLVKLCQLNNGTTSFKEYTSIAHSLLVAFKSKYSEEGSREKALASIRSQLIERERDVLVGILMDQLQRKKSIRENFGGMDTLEDLSNYLLIDVEMSGIAKVSEVKQVLNSLQHYIQRCHMGLEGAGTITCEVGDKEWAWRSHYRLWEANRKVFLYPENYLDPGLRKIKTPIFNELEEELLQSDVTNETVTNAYLHFFDKLDEMAKIKIVDRYRSKVTHPEAISGEDTIFCIGKTEHHPPVYYYRSALFNDSEELIQWRPWQKISLSISAGTVKCCYINHSLHLFWVEGKNNKEQGKRNNHTATVKFSHLNLSGSWMNPQTICKNLLINELPHEFSFDQGGARDLKLKIDNLPDDSHNNADQFNSGRKPNGFLKDEETDPNWNATVGKQANSWVAGDDTKSRWLKNNTGDKIYKRTLDFHNFPHEVLGFTLMLAADDWVEEVKLNGISLGKPIKSSFGLNQQDEFIINEALLNKKGAVLNGRGSNKLEIEVHDGTNNTGLRVEFLDWKFEHLALSLKTSNEGEPASTNIEGSISDETIKQLKQLRKLLVEGGLAELFAAQRSTEKIDTLGDSWPIKVADLDLDQPLAIYFREVFFHIPFLIAVTLNRNQRFEDAQSWYHFIFDPMVTKKDALMTKDKSWQYLLFLDHVPEALDPNLHNEKQLAIWKDDPFDPHAIAGLRLGAYEKAIVMKYIDNLLDWGDQLFAADNWESIVQAMLFYQVSQDMLGKKLESKKPLYHPDVRTVNSLVNDENNKTSEVSFEEAFNTDDLDYFPIMPNTHFAGYWDRVADRLFKIRHSMNIKGMVRQLALFQPPLDPSLLIGGRAVGGADMGQVNPVRLPNYRFTTMIQHAKNVTASLTQLGSALLSALEHKNAQQLNLLRSSHEKAILHLTTHIKEKQIEDANKNLDALNASLSAAKKRLSDYDESLKNGLSHQENQKTRALKGAMAELGIAGITHIAASPMHLMPTIFGVADGGESPGDAFEAVAGAAENAADILEKSSQIAESHAEFERRKEEWILSKALAEYDIEQIEAQLDGARINIELAELNMKLHQQSQLQANEWEDLLGGKFSNEELYSWMVGRISSVYFQTYKIALDLAKSAEMAYQYERNTNPSIIKSGYWDNLKKGLLAGEGLMLGLEQLDKSYRDGNERTLEIEKIMLVRELSVYKEENGKYSFSLNQKLFDDDFPGHYCRKIKTVAITIQFKPEKKVPAYKSIPATLTQTTNRVLLKSDPEGVTFLKGGKGWGTDKDVNVRSDLYRQQRIAISKGTNDSGLFELNFQDERYLPFEGTGAISDWELEVCGSNKKEIVDSISEIMIHLRYTALASEQ